MKDLRSEPYCAFGAVESHRGIAFADPQCKGDVLYRHVFEMKVRHRLEVFRQAAHRLDQAGQPHGVGCCLIGRRGRIGQGVAQWLGFPHEGAPDMGDAYILRYAGNIAF
jgi:hypothetical protein